MHGLMMAEYTAEIGNLQVMVLLFVDCKGKAFPLQAWTGHWGSRRLRLQNF
jgi:hypothetical protein